MERPELSCIVCAKSFRRVDGELYHPMRYFENNCACRECLRKEKEGWKLLADNSKAR